MKNKIILLSLFFHSFSPNNPNNPRNMYDSIVHFVKGLQGKFIKSSEQITSEQKAFSVQIDPNQERQNPLLSSSDDNILTNSRDTAWEATDQRSRAGGKQ